MSLIQSYRLRRRPLQRNPPNDTQSTTHVRLAVERSRRSQASATRRQSSARYDGEMPDNDWWANVATLKWTRRRTGSQCSWRSTGDGRNVEYRSPDGQLAAFWLNQASDRQAARALPDSLSKYHNNVSGRLFVSLQSTVPTRTFDILNNDQTGLLLTCKCLENSID